MMAEGDKPDTGTGRLLPPNQFAGAAFVPDSSVVSEVLPSANFGERRGGIAPDLIVLHYTGMPDTEAALRRLCVAGTEVSAHYVVREDGRVVQCVREADRAWHAGESSWGGDSDVNSRSIGIEIANPGHDWGYPEFPRRQIAALIALCRGIMIRRNIPAHRVVGHSDVAPTRKQDPGEKLPWDLMARSGVGVWNEPAALAGGEQVYLGARGAAVNALQKALASIGYGLPVTGEYDITTRDVVMAFQRHFRPARIDGIADTSTVATLGRLLRSIGA
ncbi:MAG: N-acetylmuramoyl-L-alanine amidase [Xanthobacteraceae bacterium]|nr:MAG: N-acetylmuramoyl-L-alanine amidase [Xanthobacteraceae bacterium]